ncbi:MAG: spore germination protein GerW family protein [Chloroflexota bacterium]
MEIQEVMSQARDTITVKRVFGEPIERDGTTVIPVARVMGGSGFGSGQADMTPAATGEDGADGAPGSGSAGGVGGGFGVMAGPAGVYVIKNGSVSWQPAVEPGRIAIMGGIAAFLVLFGLRMVIRAFRR